MFALILGTFEMKRWPIEKVLYFSADNIKNSPGAKIVTKSSPADEESWQKENDYYHPPEKPAFGSINRDA